MSAQQWRMGRYFALLASTAMLVLACSSPSETSDDTKIATAETAGNQDADPGSAGQKESTAAILRDYVESMQGYADCLRQHGISGTPDPNQFGQILLNNEIVPDQAKFHQAQVACEAHAVPMPPEVSALVTGEYEDGLTDSQKQEFAEYASCMQRSGAPDFPDPQPNGAPGDAEWDPMSPGAKRATSACASIVGAPATAGPGVG